MAKRVRLVLAVLFVVLVAAVAIWGARVHPGKTVHRSPPTKRDEIPDYLMTKSTGILQPTILSPRDTILGYTTFDEQHDTRVLRMNALDYQDPAGLHFTFMRMVDTVGNYCHRSVDYTYWDTAGWYSLPAPRITAYNGSGYNALELIRPLSGYFKSHSRAVVCYHTICGGVPEGSVILSIEPNTPGAMELEGAHYWYHIPDGFDNRRGYFPACAVDSLNRIHVAMHDAFGYTGNLGYVRCEERSGDKIMCWAPGKDSLIVDKETYYTDQSYEVTVFGKAYAEFQIVATSKVSNKVALIWASDTEADPDVHQHGNDIFYIQSTNGGDD